MGNAMTELLALSVSVAVLGGIWAFIALGPLGGFALVWVGFIAAGCFFAAGADIKALSKTIVGMIYGAIVAWIALLIIAKVPVPGLGTVWPAIVVGVTVFFLVIVACRPMPRWWVTRCRREAGCAYGRRQLKSAIPHRSLRHLGCCARLPNGATSWFAETSTLGVASLDQRDPLASLLQG
jgi:hypothetical protein